jgi:hypothetical protein
VIQVIKDNTKGGRDVVNIKYDFSGKILEEYYVHTIEYQDNTYTTQYKKFYTYDDMGRTLKVDFQKDYEPIFTLYQYTYNELGQVTRKQIYKEPAAQTFLQDIDYKYNIKGQITNINDLDNIANDVFAMKYYFEQAVNPTATTYQNGNISAVQWKSSQNVNTKTYMYQYDKTNRLTKATYLPSNRFDAEFTYDANGNITTMKQKGPKYITTIVNGKPVQSTVFDYIDNLTYNYNGNQLTRVTDAVGNINTPLNNDFRDGGGEGAIDYTYDYNGNMLTDVQQFRK